MSTFLKDKYLNLNSNPIVVPNEEWGVVAYFSNTGETPKLIEIQEENKSYFFPFDGINSPPTSLKAWIDAFTYNLSAYVTEVILVKSPHELEIQKGRLLHTIKIEKDLCDGVDKKYLSKLSRELDYLTSILNQKQTQQINTVTTFNTENHPRGAENVSL